MSMPAEQIDPNVSRRVWMTAVGALAGVAAWFLIYVLPDVVASERALLLISAGAGGFFVALMAAAGTLPFGRAMLASVVASLPAAALLTWASLRYRSVQDFLETGHPAVAFGLILCLSLPFLIVAGRGEDSWRSYPALFSQSWEIVVRLSAALIFLGLFWAVLLLSDALFGLVGLDFIEDLLELEPVPPVLTGAVIGLALAVMVELGDYSSPFLILRLLRLFLPVVLVITAVFLGALPLRGMSGLFGALSATAVLLAMTVGIASLIASAVERSDDRAADAMIPLVSARLLALAMPVLAGLALYAVWLRVGQYGWSPDRIAAAAASATALAYGLLYAVSVLAGGPWMARIRQANTLMALCVIGVAALWLTPVLNPERISARDQLARIVGGDPATDETDLWFLGRELGVAGEAALAELAAMDLRGRAKLDARIADVLAATSRSEFQRLATRQVTRNDIATVIGSALVRPEGAAPLQASDLSGVSPQQIARWAAACRADPDAALPGCAAVRVDLLPDAAGEELLFFWQTGSETRVLALQPGGGRPPVLLEGALLPADTLARIAAADFRLGVPAVRTLKIGGAEILLLP